MAGRLIMKPISSKTRIIALTGIMVVLALISYKYNTRISEKQKMAKEQELVGMIQVAKMLASTDQKLPQGTLVEFAQLAPTLNLPNNTTSLNKIALGTENGTGKNLISWGTYPIDGHRPPKFSQGSPLRK